MFYNKGIVYPEESFQNALLRPWSSALKEDGETLELGLEGLSNQDTG